jgi:brefeldin A-resistance guanine nucleotide exchange factor 1
LLKGLSDCIKGPTGLRSEMANSPDFWSILNTLRSAPEAAGDVFQIVEELANSTHPGVTADNYEAAISLLNEFATDGQVGAQQEQQRDQGARRGKPTKPKKPEYV